MQYGCQIRPSARTSSRVRVLDDLMSNSCLFLSGSIIRSKAVVLIRFRRFATGVPLAVRYMNNCLAQFDRLYKDDTTHFRQRGLRILALTWPVTAETS
jgi:hypothetical protein